MRQDVEISSKGSVRRGWLTCRPVHRHGGVDSWRLGVRALGLVLLGLTACATAEPDGPDFSRPGESPDDGAGGGGSDLSAGGGPVGDLPGAAPGNGGSQSGHAGDGCVGVSDEAKAELLPTDVIWAIDTSGSMTASFPAIQQALNDFSQRVSDAGIDARIVLLAGASGLCVPPPLGSGQCGGAPTPGGAAPDSIEPRLLHLDLPFGANQGMGVLLDNHPAYQHLLRPHAHTHLVLTEDGQPPQSADQVIAHLEGSAAATASGPWSPGLVPGSWTFHGVVCKDGLGPGACLLSFVVPQTTLDLIDRTGGLLGDLSEAVPGSASDPFGELLEALAEQVIVGARVSCDYAIPAPPSGETLDRNAVNVVLVQGSGQDTVFPRVPDDVDCGSNSGWKYDDPSDPSRVVLCPAACEAAQGNSEARIDVQFGCETLILL